MVLLIASSLTIHSMALVVAQAQPSLQTNQALYTVRDKQVGLQGAGYNGTKSYVIWLQIPTDNSTRSTGLSFVTTQKGEIPPGISLPIEPNSALGTYLASISDSAEADRAFARAHYGLWGTDKYVYQRTEVVRVGGGGVLPKTSLKVTIRNPAAAFVYDATVAANETGTFLATWKIPFDAVTESYTVFIDGVGTYDYPNVEFVSISKFSVTPALLNVAVHTQPSTLYERTETASAEFIVQYPDSAAVVSVKDGLSPIELYAGQFKMADLTVTASGAASGIWAVQFKIPPNASLAVDYKFVMRTNAFNDGNGNNGPEGDIETNGFNILRAMLQVSASFNKTHYQVPFDTMTGYAQVSYPDGTSIRNATVQAWLSAPNWMVNASVEHDEAREVWMVWYPFSLSDLLRPGSWEIWVEATDMYDNQGSASFEITAEPYMFIEIVVVIVVVLAVVRWILSKFWRRIYLTTKRAVSAFSGRLRPPSFGRYFIISPVTPCIRSSFSRARFLYLKR